MGNQFGIKQKFYAAIVKSKMVLRDYNSPLELMNENLDEDIKDDEVLISVNCSSITSNDIKIQEKWFHTFFKIKFPFCLGTDASGKVIKIGKNVKDFKIGEEVFGLNSKGGTFSNYSVFKESELCSKPKNISFEEVSLIPTIGLTSLQSLRNYGGINFDKEKEMKKIIIIGAAGNIAKYSINLAKLFGCEIVGVSKKENFKNILFETKIDELYDYEELSNIVDEDFDLILDFKSNKNIQKILKTNLKKKGKIVQIGHAEPISYFKMISFGISKFKSYIFTRAPKLYSLSPNKDDLKFLSELHEKKEIEFKKFKTYPLDKINDAFEKRKEKKEKVVLKI
eukprot:gene6041-10042_t